MRSLGSTCQVNMYKVVALIGWRMFSCCSQKRSMLVNSSINLRFPCNDFEVCGCTRSVVFFNSS